jgi:hypothetical protein
MGYTTTFDGHLTIEPPLPPDACAAADAARFDIPEDDDAAEQLDGCCQWEIVDNGSTIVWDDGEKFYDSPRWMAWLIARHIPAGHNVNGEIEAEGEEYGDRWMLKVVDRVVTVHEAIPHAYYVEGPTVTI